MLAEVHHNSNRERIARACVQDHDQVPGRYLHRPHTLRARVPEPKEDLDWPRCAVVSSGSGVVVVLEFFLCSLRQRTWRLDVEQLRVGLRSTTWAWSWLRWRSTGLGWRRCGCWRAPFAGRRPSEAWRFGASAWNKIVFGFGVLASREKNATAVRDAAGRGRAAPAAGSSTRCCRRSDLWIAVLTNDVPKDLLAFTQTSEPAELKHIGKRRKRN